MATNNITPFTEKDLSALVEEFITQQSEFTLKGLYSYIIYWGMEDKRIADDQLKEADKECVNGILNRIVKDGRIRIDSEDNTKYLKQR